MSKIQREEFEKATTLSISLINQLQEAGVNNESTLRLALAIAYTTLSKGTKVDLHATIELIMAIYKNMEIIND